MHIQFGYWKSRDLGLPYSHHEIFEYSVDKRNEIIDACLDKGLSVMIRPMSTNTGWKYDGIIIWVDKGRFGQS